MKIEVFCRQCIDTKDSQEEPYGRIYVWANDTGVSKMQCPRGHESFLAFKEEKFELLFDSGVNALMDGYPREAVSSIAASVERFHEFCIKVFLVECNVGLEHFTEAWKQISNQSERQLGAFLFLYLQHYNNAGPQINPKDITFRNSVIHKGFICSSEEVIDYGNRMLKYIFDILGPLRQHHKAAIQAIAQARVSDSLKLVPRGAHISLLSSASIVNLFRDFEGWGEYSLDKWIKENVRRRE